LGLKKNARGLNFPKETGPTRWAMPYQARRAAVHFNLFADALRRL
jgi:hypothetical protein